MRTSEVLNKAADLIQQKGWGRGVGTWVGNGGLCIEGAIAAAMGRPVLSLAEDSINAYELQVCPAGAAVRDYLGNALLFEEGHPTAGEPMWLCHWNDKYGRTENEVIETLRACALIEEARENQSIKNEIKEEVSA